MSRTGSKNGADDPMRLKMILDELIKKEDNKLCADCGCRGPRWASINLGVLICISCSGIHRSLGVHLTFVRSVNLDTWTSEQVAQMQKWGNAQAKKYYEANIPNGYSIPNENSSVREKEIWIRDKYERKRFIPRDDVRSKKKQDTFDEARIKHEKVSEKVSASRKNSREKKPSTHSTHSAPATAPSKKVETTDFLSFNDFNVPPALTNTPQMHLAAANAPKQDEWANFASMSTSTSTSIPILAPGDAPTPQQQHHLKMATIMASFATPPSNPNVFSSSAMQMNMGMQPSGSMGGFGNPAMMQSIQAHPNMMQSMNPVMGVNQMHANTMMGMNPAIMGQSPSLMSRGGTSMMPNNSMHQQQSNAFGQTMFSQPSPITSSQPPIGMHTMMIQSSGGAQQTLGFQPMQQQSNPAPAFSSQSSCGGMNSAQSAFLQPAPNMGVHHNMGIAPHPPTIQPIGMPNAMRQSSHQFVTHGFPASNTNYRNPMNAQMNRNSCF